MAVVVVVVVVRHRNVHLYAWPVGEHTVCTVASSPWMDRPCSHWIFAKRFSFPEPELQNTQLLDVPHLKRQYDKAYDELDNGRTNILWNRVVFKCALIYIAIFTTIWASYILRVYLTFPAEGGKHIIVMYGDRITIVHIQLEREHCSCAAPWTIFSVTFSSCFKASGEMRPLRFPLI